MALTVLSGLHYLSPAPGKNHSETVGLQVKQFFMSLRAEGVAIHVANEVKQSPEDCEVCHHCS